jgi:hypothetical protein
MNLSGSGPKGAPGPNRAARRLGSNPPSGRSNADDHFQELIGSSGLWIYVEPNVPLQGYDRLREQLESHGCMIGPADDAPIDLGRDYPALKIASTRQPLIPPQVLKVAHRWAHRHNYVHSFYKPEG